MEHLRISTMTAVAKLCTDIDIEKMYNSLRIDDIVKFIEFKKQYTKLHNFDNETFKTKTMDKKYWEDQFIQKINKRYKIDF